MLITTCYNSSNVGILVVIVYWLSHVDECAGNLEEELQKKSGLTTTQVKARTAVISSEDLDQATDISAREMKHLKIVFIIIQ